MSTKPLVEAFLLFLLFSASLPLSAAPAGTLDQSFDEDGKLITQAGADFSNADALIQQSDGKLVAAGVSRDIFTNERFSVVRYNADGSLDTGFGGTGIVNTDIGFGNAAALAAAQQEDGSLIVAGFSFNNTDNDFTLVRYTRSGVLDTGFNGTGIVITPVGSADDGAFAVVQDSSKTVTAAGFSRISGTDDFALVRYNLDGTLDTRFGSDGKVTTDFGQEGNDVAFALIRQSDGKLVAAGYSDNGNNEDFALARYNADGSLDTSFSRDGRVRTPVASGLDRALSVVQQSDGKLVAAGYSEKGDTHVIAVVRYNADGTLDKSFSKNGKVTTTIGSLDDRAYKVIQLPDGKLLVAGYTQAADDDANFVLVRYNSDGSLDTSFSGDGKLATNFGTSAAPGIDQAFAAVQQNDEQIVLAGASNAGGLQGFALARYRFDDEDSDGIKDSQDNCPANKNKDQADADNDGAGDVCDPDDDNDGVPDTEDACPFDPTETSDTDGDLTCNNADPDDDNDGVLDGEDPSPLVGMSGENNGDYFGYSVANAGDIDQDGFDDIIVGSPRSNPVLPGNNTPAGDAGSVIVYSGKTALPIQDLSFTGDAAGDQFGIAVAGAGDIDKDGVPDIVVGAHQADAVDPISQKLIKNAGRTLIYSGASGTRLFDFYGEAAGDSLGVSVAIVGDVDQDGFAEVLAGAWKADGSDAATGKKQTDSGAAYLYSGKTHLLLHKFQGENKGDYFGYSLTASDVDNDARPDLVIGAYRHDVPAGKKTLSNAGSAYIFSAVDFSLLRRLDGAHAGDRLGFAVAGIADVNDDAHADVLVGAPNEDAPNPTTHQKVKDSGTVHIFSGLDGALLDPLESDQPVNTDPQASALFGSAIHAAGDFNNDSVPDFVVGAYKYDAVIEGVKTANTGKVSVHSGKDGGLLFSADGHAKNGFFSFAVGGGGDQNQDGLSDIIIGTYKADPGNLNTLKPKTDAGVAEIIHGR
ncbi:thrombospondin type 3 repeat-containing protein [Methylosarcina fibrata]|uniref:thrombospondin type 3 repeat-containing protein n=1 Tax=Methylosarcina fibrata TaxID=105972 RepID=UPI00036F7985|nr:thrombospondin type 3 repeat-containing protein [Methylosarcina fibrata]